MEELDLNYYWRIILRRKAFILTVAFVIFAITLVILLLMPKTYEGETVLIFPKQGSGDIGAQLSQFTGISLPSLLGTAFAGRDVYYTVLQSRTLSETVCKRYALDEYDVSYKDLQDNLELVKEKEGALKVTVNVPTSWLKKGKDKSNLKNRTAKLAADLANTYIQELQKYDRENTLFLSKKNRLFIEEQLQLSKEELIIAEDRLAKFQEENPSLLPPERSGVLADKSVELIARRMETDIQIQNVKEELSKVRSTWEEGAPEGFSPKVFVNSAIISGLQQRLAGLEVKLATLQEDFTNEYPEVIAVKQEIEKLQERIDDETSKIIAGKASSLSPAYQELLKKILILDIEHAGLLARRDAIMKAIAEVEEWSAELPPKEKEYVRVLRDVRARETVYMTLLSEHAKARIEEARDTDRFLVLDVAKPPKKPAKPRMKFTLAVSLLLGILIGSLLSFAQAHAVHSSRNGGHKHIERHRNKRLEV